MASYLRSCEAIGSYIIPSILSSNNATDSKLLELHWNDSVNAFRCLAHKLIDTFEFCSILVNALDDTLSEQSVIKKQLRTILLKCEVFYEHIEENLDHLYAMKTSMLELYIKDFKVMIDECRASLRSSIELSRLRKRFCILLSVIRNIEISLSSSVKEPPVDEIISLEERQLGQEHVSSPNVCKNISFQVAGSHFNDSLKLATDLDVFISNTDPVTCDRVLHQLSFVRAANAIKEAVQPRDTIVRQLNKRKYLHNSLLICANFNFNRIVVAIL